MNTIYNIIITWIVTANNPLWVRLLVSGFIGAILFSTFTEAVRWSVKEKQNTVSQSNASKKIV